MGRAGGGDLGAANRSKGIEEGQGSKVFERVLRRLRDASRSARIQETERWYQ